MVWYLVTALWHYVIDIFLAMNKRHRREGAGDRGVEGVEKETQVTLEKTQMFLSEMSQCMK